MEWRYPNTTSAWRNNGISKPGEAFLLYLCNCTKFLCWAHALCFGLYSTVAEKLNFSLQWLRNSNPLTGLQSKYLDSSRIIMPEHPKAKCNWIKEPEGGKLSVSCFNTQVCSSCLLVYAGLHFDLRCRGDHNGFFSCENPQPDTINLSFLGHKSVA